MPQIFRPEPGEEPGSNIRYRELLLRMRRTPEALLGMLVVPVANTLMREDDENATLFMLVSYVPGSWGKSGYYLDFYGRHIYVQGGKARFGHKGQFFTFPTKRQASRCPGMEVQALITETEQELQTERSLRDRLKKLKEKK